MMHWDIAHDLPDAGGGMCCEGAAAYGPGGCTCWEPIYDCEQKPTQAGPMDVRSTMCADCAFRPNSPERCGDDRYAHADELDEVVTGGQFACHQGMRRRLKMKHPSGVVVDVNFEGAYSPPSDIHPTKADGSPADLCAGWWRAVQAIKGGVA